MKRIVLITLMAAAYCVVACKKAAPEEAAAAAPTAPVKPPVTIKGSTGKSTERSFPRFLRVTGQLAAQNDAVVAADAVGRVVTAPIERGTLVKEGDVLATLDERQAKLSVAEASASVALAKSRLALAKNEQERNKPLAEKKAVADADYQKLLTEVAAREAELAASVARLDLAQKTLDDSVIRAPFSGVVAERMMEPGEYVRQDSSVARVVDVASLRLMLSVPETEVGGLKIGQTVEFTTAAFPNQSFQGKLKFLGTAMREASRDLIIEAAVDNADGKLRPGFFSDARIQLREEKAIAVPEKALRIDGTRRRVFVITEDKTLSERLVEVGESREGFIEIRRGVAKDETLLMEPPADATDGLPFQPAA